MKLIEVLEHNPVSWYITQYDQNSKVKKAGLIEVCQTRARYCNVTKKERAEIEPYVEDKKALYSGLPVIINRTRKFNLATIYYVGGLRELSLPIVVDIHYHIDRRIGGRTKEELRKTVDDILTSFAYQKNLAIGAYDCHKTHNRKNKKVYTKIS